MVIAIISLVMGAAVTWAVAWYYYKRAGDELRDEAVKLQRTSEMIFRWLEVNGQNIEAVRDSKGHLQSLARSATFSDAVSVGGGRVTELKVTKVGSKKPE